MKVLIIYAHPREDSFNHAVKESFESGLKFAGHEYEVIDLYKEEFNPVITESELKGEIGEQVKGYQEKIKQSDYLAFIYPTWWFRCPPILEGWFDKVFTSGFAFKYIPFIGSFKRPIGLLPVKKAVVIETYGGPGWFYKLFRCTIPWKRLKLGVLKFCGIKKLIHYPLYYAPFTTDKKRKHFLDKVRKLGKGLR
ncbi:NAD(P)H-dependent oxidoreductase [Patescibacteria group bacterium]|nr:NAD(P)H-dependent oxidoreductase [Patescibacteria group bacterium]